MPIGETSRIPQNSRSNSVWSCLSVAHLKIRKNSRYALNRSLKWLRFAVHMFIFENTKTKKSRKNMYQSCGKSRRTIYFSFKLLVNSLVRILIRPTLRGHNWIVCACDRESVDMHRCVCVSLRYVCVVVVCVCLCHLHQWHSHAYDIRESCVWKSLASPKQMKQTACTSYPSVMAQTLPKSL